MIQLLRQSLCAQGHATKHRVLPTTNPAFLDLQAQDRVLPLLGLQCNLEEFLQQEKIDVVHAHNLHRGHCPGLASVIVNTCRARRIPLVITVHDIGTYSSSAALASANAALSAAVTVTTSPYNHKLLAKTLGIRAQAVIEPCVSFPATPSRHSTEAVSIAIPGRLSPPKGILESAIIAGHLSNSRRPVTVMLSNSRHPHYGADLSYVDAVRKLDSTFPTLKCLFNEAPNPNSLYCTAVVTICMPLAPEGFGMVPLESLAFGTPVLVHPLGGLSWTAGVPGVRIGDPFDALKTCTLLQDMILNRSLLREEIAKGRAALEERFSPQLMATRHLAVYERALKKHR